MGILSDFAQLAAHLSKDPYEKYSEEFDQLLEAARASTDISERRYYLATALAKILELKRLMMNPETNFLGSSAQHSVPEVELQIAQLEMETRALEFRAKSEGNLGGKYLEKKGMISEAIGVYERLVAKMVDTPFTYRRLAILYRKLKSIDDEVRVLTAALKAIPKSNRKHYEWFKARLLEAQKKGQTKAPSATKCNGNEGCPT